MRYTRQIALAEIGEKGQEQLQKAKVLVIGAGGLGCPCITYLTEVGIGYLEILDMDIVSCTNLNRQFLYNDHDIDSYKAHVAERKLRLINTEIIIHGHAKKITEENIEETIQDFNIIVDCIDNIQTRKIIHNACLKLNIPLVEAGIEGFYGFVTTIKKGFPCLNCMGYFDSKDKKEIPVLGAVAGIIGSLQALECIKVLLNIEGVLFGKILEYDAKKQEIEIINIPEKNECMIHKE